MLHWLSTESTQQFTPQLVCFVTGFAFEPKLPNQLQFNTLAIRKLGLSTYFTELRPLSVNRTGAIKVKRWDPPKAVHFITRAPQLFRGARFQTKAPQLSYNILTSLTQPGRLRVKLQGNRAETSDLIFMRKTQHFPKMHQFWTFTGSRRRLHKR